GDPRPLIPLFEQLAELERGQAGGPVVLIQIGDSHTAGDRFSGRLRALFQERFGDAGRGMLPPGVPFDYYEPTDVAVSQTGGWDTRSMFRRDAAGLFGLTGFRQTASDPDAVITIASADGDGFDSASVGILRDPAGGTLEVAATGADGNQTVWTIDTRGQARIARYDIPVAAGTRAIGLSPAGDGPVTLLSTTLQRSTPGIVFDSHGIGGATVDVIARAEPATLAWEVDQRDPAAIFVVFGTNEGFDPDLTEADYAARFRDRVRQLQAAAPEAAIVVVGPPDGNRLPPGCDRAEATTCSPTAPADPETAACQWYPPSGLEAVKRAQTRVASQEGWYFWDWSQVMGGACGIHQWANTDPPLAWGDHVHLREQGYARSAQALFGQVMAHYDTWRRGGIAGAADPAAGAAAVATRPAD
ncbi:MAG: hypothetical protein GVY28_04420, partial [Alphaproteobacteria bacterium]|nr:hypothetical protein [Alphaproteobacteria bacterium]